MRVDVVRISCKGFSDPALRIKGDDDDDDDGMECAWRGSSGRSSSPVGGGEGSRSRRHCADSVLLALLRATSSGERPTSFVETASRLEKTSTPRGAVGYRTRGSRIPPREDRKGS